MADLIFDRSIYKPYFNADDAQALAWAENVLQKLIGKEVAKSIKRVNDTNNQTTDFEDLYRPITIFFGYLVRLAREFRDFKDNEFLADNYINNEGLFTCGDETLNQLGYLITNSLRTRGARGTTRMITRSFDEDVPHGELLRLVCWNPLTFFKLGVARPQYNSWNIDHSSPLARGCTNRYDLNLAYEYTEDVLDLSKYPTINENYVFLSKHRGKDCIEIEGVPFGQVAGIGSSDLDKEIPIDPRLNYEITFYVAQDITLENFTFKCKAFNSTGDEIALSDIVTGVDRNFFFETRRLNQAGRFYMIRGIIFNKDHELISADEARLNIGFGQHLRSNDNVVSIIPYLVMDNNMSDDSDSESDNFDSESTDQDSGAFGSDESGYWSDDSYEGDPSIFIWNLKVTPCNTNYNRCYLNNKNFIDVFVVNNNGKYTDQQINNIMRKYFIPYNTAFKVTHIGQISEIDPDESFLLLEDGSYILLETEDRILLE